MAVRHIAHVADAHYHAVRVTAAWERFARTMDRTARDSIDRRLARDAQRRRETTYARGVPGRT